MPNLEEVLNTDTTGMGIALSFNFGGTAFGSFLCSVFFHRFGHYIILLSYLSINCCCRFIK